MRRLSLTAAAVVSTALLLTTTSVLAIAPAKVNLGTLKPLGGWKVGTVNQGSEQYCAMVGTYNNKVVAAFARNPQGLGSLALDFGDAIFAPGKEYDVSLSAEKTAPRHLKARASNERSLVVQIGQDSDFYEVLSRNGVLGIDLAVASLRLDLARFAPNHKDLVACASQLSPAERDAEPRLRSAELPVDRELAALSQARSDIAAVSTTADDIEKTMAGKASSLDALEEQLEAEARAEMERSRTTVATLDNKQDAVREKLAAKGVDVALDRIEPAAGDNAQPVSMGRKLLAAIGGKEDLTVPPSTGSASRDIESRELGLADSQRAAEETAQALALKNEIAAIEAEKNAQAQETLEAFDARQEKMTAQTQRLEEKRDTALSKLSAAAASEEKDKSLRANVIAQQAKIADVSDALAKEEAALPRQLAVTQSAFESRIAALEAERDTLRAKIDSVVAENEVLKKSSSQGKPADRLEVAQLKKQLLEMQTQRQAEVSRAAAAQTELDAARQQIAALRQSSQAEMARLAEMQRSLEGERTQLAAERNAEKSSAQARGDIEHIRKALAQKQAELEAVAIEQGAEAARLEREKQTLADAAQKSQSSAPAILAASQKLVDHERAELNDLRGRIKTLETDLAKARTQSAVASAAAAAAPQAVAKPNDAETAELARLKNENASLRQRLASFLSSEKTAAAPVAQQEAVEQVASVGEEKQPVQKPVVVTAAIKEPVQKEPVQADTAGVSPVLASLLGQRAADAEKPAVAQPTTASDLNAQEPAAGALEHQPGNDKRMPAVPAVEVQAETVAPQQQAVAAPQPQVADLAPITAAQVQAKADDKGVFGIFGRAMGYNGASANAAASPQAQSQSQTEPASIIRVSRPAVAPAPESVPAQAEAVQQVSSAEGNRAAAFLDNIMSYHRPGGATSRTQVAPQPRIAAVQPVPAVMPDTTRLNAIETAAGAPALAAPVVVPKAPAPQHIELATLLQQSGLGRVAIITDANGLAHWSTDAFNGMYEKQPAQSDFSRQTEAYLSRYAQDCRSKLKMDKGAVQQTASGKLRVVDIACTDAGNSYATAIVFTQGQDGFAAVLHAGQADTRQHAKRVATDIAARLKTAGGIAVNQSTAPTAVPASFAPQPAIAAPSSERPRFRIEIEAPATAPADVYDLPTTIVE